MKTISIGAKNFPFKKVNEIIILRKPVIPSNKISLVIQDNYFKMIEINSRKSIDDSKSDIVIACVNQFLSFIDGFDMEYISLNEFVRDSFRFNKFLSKKGNKSMRKLLYDVRKTIEMIKKYETK